LKSRRAFGFGDGDESFDWADQFIVEHREIVLSKVGDRMSRAVQ